MSLECSRFSEDGAEAGAGASAALPALLHNAARCARPCPAARASGKVAITPRDGPASMPSVPKTPEAAPARRSSALFLQCRSAPAIECLVRSAVLARLVPTVGWRDQPSSALWLGLMAGPNYHRLRPSTSTRGRAEASGRSVIRSSSASLSPSASSACSLSSPSRSLLSKSLRHRAAQTAARRMTA